MTSPQNETAIPATDFLGRQIKAGLTVCYPVRRRLRMWMQRLSVVQVVEDGKMPYIVGYNSEGRQVKVHNLRNCVVVEPPQQQA